MSDQDNSSEELSEELAEERTERAEERTDFAADRTLLANERTFAGWARTALASIGLGVGFQALYKASEPIWVPKLISTVFVLLGVLLIWLAVLRAKKVLSDQSPNHVQLTSGRTFLVTAVCMSAGGLGLVAAIWFLV